MTGGEIRKKKEKGKRRDKREFKKERLYVTKKKGKGEPVSEKKKEETP